MNPYTGLVCLGACRCRKSLPIRFRRPVVPCFLSLESRSLKNLILIRFCLARAMRAGGLRRGAPAIRAAGRPAFAIGGAACRILWPGRWVRGALSDLLDRKPHLLRALAQQLLPPPA